MAWTNLRTDYTDAVWTGQRKYVMTTNNDDTVSFIDVTPYSNKENSFFGSSDANKMNSAINTLMNQGLESKVTELESKITALESKVASKSAYLTWGTSLSFKMDTQHPHALVITTNGWVYSVWNSGGGVFDELLHSTNNAQAKPTFVSTGTETDRTVTIKFNSNNAATVIMA